MTTQVFSRCAGALSACLPTRRISRLLPALALAAGLLPGVQPAQAEGTRTIHPAAGIGSTGNRGVMDLTNANAAGVARQTQFTYVYAREGEVILLGSRNRTTNTGTNRGQIRLWAPPVGAPVLTILKTGPANVTPGNQIVFTIVVTNTGPVVANGVAVTDPTPAGLTFVSNGGDCLTAFPCAVGTMAVGDTRTITVTLMVPTGYSGPSPIVNVATVSSTSTTATSSSTASVPVAFGLPPRMVPANANWALWLIAVSMLLLGAGAMSRIRD